jgi:signal transduction histidine kinase
MKLECSTVLILSSNPAFARAITEHWPHPQAPEFVVLQEDLCGDLQRDTYDLAVADLSSESRRELLSSKLTASGDPAILVDAKASSLSLHGDIVTLPHDAYWSKVVGLLAYEMLCRTLAQQRAADADLACSVAHAEATLGRYMSEMRHTVNNALTSVLGNAELMQLEPGLPGSVLAQADTIRNMALRLHEIFQRFSSIEKELHVLARESGKTISPAPSLSSRASASSI